jgi:hypothetical protein
MRFVGEKNPFGLWEDGEAKGQRCASTYKSFKNDSFDFQCFHVLILATKNYISFGQTLAIMLANFFSHWKVRKIRRKGTSQG